MRYLSASARFGESIFAFDRMSALSSIILLSAALRTTVLSSASEIL